MSDLEFIRIINDNYLADFDAAADALEAALDAGHLVYDREADEWTSDVWPDPDGRIAARMREVVARYDRLRVILGFIPVPDGAVTLDE